MLISVDEISDRTFLGLWKFDESDFVESHCPISLRSQMQNLSKSRRHELEAVYGLVNCISGGKNIVIGHNDDGKPLLDDWHISISHTRGYATVIMSHSKEVAVDIEYISNRVDRIAGKFVREDEKFTDTTARLLAWCVKETVYKYFSEQHLGLFEMRIFPFEIKREGCLLCENMRTNETLSVNYCVTDEYILTYT